MKIKYDVEIHIIRVVETENGDYIDQTRELISDEYVHTFATVASAREFTESISALCADSRIAAKRGES